MASSEIIVSKEGCSIGMSDADDDFLPVTKSLEEELPPGFRFHPTEEELIASYLTRKSSSSPLPVSITADMDLYKYDRWDLPRMLRFEQVWYFLSPRERKYPNGSRPKRAVASGHWKGSGVSKMPECFNDVKNSGICPGERTHRVRGWTPPSTPIWSQKSEKSLDPTEAAIAADQVSPTPTGYSQMLRENGKNVITGSSKEPAWRPALKARRGDECSSKLQGEFPPPSDESHPKKQMKNLGLVAAVIFAANCSTIMSAGKQREAAGQSVLIASMLSLMLALLLILASIGVPKLSYSSAKIVGLFSALLTAFSYLTFLAIQLGSISKDTVCMVSVAAFVFSATIIFLTCTTKMKCAPAALVGADLV